MYAERRTIDPTSSPSLPPDAPRDGECTLRLPTVDVDPVALRSPDGLPLTSGGFAWLLAEASVHDDPATHGWSRDR